jgi:hypothetical protein
VISTIKRFTMQIYFDNIISLRVYRLFLRYFNNNIIINNQIGIIEVQGIIFGFVEKHHNSKHISKNNYIKI